MTQKTERSHADRPAARAARRSEAKLLGEVLADAFAEDPVFGWLIPPHGRGRDARMRAFFTSMSRAYLRQGKPCYLGGDAGAVALWAPPGRWRLQVDQIAREAAAAGFAFRGRLLRALRTQLEVERLHPRDCEPHWYLGYLGARQKPELGDQEARKTSTIGGAFGEKLPRTPPEAGLFQRHRRKRIRLASRPDH